MKASDRLVVLAAVRRCGVPAAAGRRRVRLQIVLGPRQRAADPDAYWKSLLDALVHAGALTDDNRQGVELTDPTFVRGLAPATVVILEEGLE